MELEKRVKGRLRWVCTYGFGLSWSSLPPRVRWTYDFTCAGIPVLQQELEWALQRQNRRFADTLRRRNLPAKWRQRGAIAVSLVGLVALVELSATLSPAYRREHLLLFVGGAVFFLATLALGIAFPRYQAWERRFADGMLARHAERMLAPLAARAPFTQTYELDDVLRTAAQLVSQKNTAWRLSPDVRLSRAFTGNERERRLEVAREALGALVAALPAAQN